MRESFTQTLRAAMERAQQEARRLNQEFVGTEHLLAGVLCGNGEATRTLRQNDLSAERLASALLAQLPHAANEPIITGDLPLSPKAQRAVNVAIVKAQSLRQNNVSTRFLLLALLEEPETLIREVFRKGGADLDQLQFMLSEEPSEPEA